MLKTLAAIAIGCLCASSALSEDVTALLAKPVNCANTIEDGKGLFYGFYQLGLKPIMAFTGSSYTKEGFTFASTYYIMYNIEDDKIAVLEAGPNGRVCVITGASAAWVSFDGDELSESILDMIRE